MSSKGRPREEVKQEDNKRRRINNNNLRYNEDHSGEIQVLVDSSEVEDTANKEVRNGLYFVQNIKGFKVEELPYIKSHLKMYMPPINVGTTMG